MRPQIHPSWLAHLEAEFQLPYMQALKSFLQTEKQARKIIYPPGKLIFNALNSTALDEVRVVVLGQDPYHGPNQAHGLAFSVPDGVKTPPSLQNIFKEIKTDLSIENNSGNLQSWAAQGVLLLNAVLTVEKAAAASHQGKGWEEFTDKVIAIIDQECEHVVFMLWGSYAQRKGAQINPQKHLILRAPHPSPLSAHRGFLGCEHFSQCNEYLITHGKQPINWQIT